MVNPYLKGRGMSHFQDMPNPHAFPSNPPPRTLPAPIPVMATAPALIPAMVTAPHHSQSSLHLHPRYEPRRDFVSAQEALHGYFPNYTPQNLVQEHDFHLGIQISKEPELPDFDFGQWQHDANVSLLTLSHDSYNFRSLAGISFRQTEEEAHFMGTSSLHDRKVLKAHEQFI
jgi:hypothetical protein